jgi:hypothetical protein
MFRALDGRTGEELVSLDVDPEAPPVGHEWEEDRGKPDPFEVRLRELSNGGRLICRGCRGEVHFRRGRWRVAHFSHAAIAGCRHARASAAEHLAATAALYAWLRGKCDWSGKPLEKHAASVEHWVEDERCKRPIDCRLAGQDGAVACDYLLLDRLMRYDERDAWSAYHGRTGTLRPIGLGRRFKLWRRGTAVKDDALPKADEVVQAELAPQEQEATRPSHFALPPHHAPEDVARESGSGRDRMSGGTMHFLVSTSDPPRPTPQHWKLVTLRLERPWPSRVTPAVVRSSPLTDVLINPKDGDFVHPGEMEAFSQWAAEVNTARAELVERQAEAERRAAEHRRRRREIEAIQREAWRRPGERRFRQSPPPVPPPSPSAFQTFRDGTCVACGRTTNDWYVWYGDGTCRCNACKGST